MLHIKELIDTRKIIEFEAIYTIFNFIRKPFIIIYNFAVIFLSFIQFEILLINLQPKMNHLGTPK